MSLHKSYKENKDEINSSILGDASDLAVGRLMQERRQPFEAFVEPDDPDCHLVITNTDGRNE